MTMRYTSKIIGKDKDQELEWGTRGTRLKFAAQPLPGSVVRDDRNRLRQGEIDHCAQWWVTYFLRGHVLAGVIFPQWGGEQLEPWKCWDECLYHLAGDY